MLHHLCVPARRVQKSAWGYSLLHRHTAVPPSQVTKEKKPPLYFLRRFGVWTLLPLVQRPCVADVRTGPLHNGTSSDGREHGPCTDTQCRSEEVRNGKCS
jgi:hypothetical protein